MMSFLSGRRAIYQDAHIPMGIARYMLGMIIVLLWLVSA